MKTGKFVKTDKATTSQNNKNNYNTNNIRRVNNTINTDKKNNNAVLFNTINFNSISKRIFKTRKRMAWYWDVRVWIPVYILILLIVILYKSSAEPVIIEKVVEVAQETIAETEPEVTEPEEVSDIVMLARLADSVAHGRSPEVQKAVMWVAINRSEDRSHGYGLSLKEEIMRPKQWQQFDSEGAYLRSTYIIAEEVYETWVTGGARPFYNDMLWFVLNGDGSITLRNQFKTGGKNLSVLTIGQ